MVTPLGCGVETTWKRLIKGESGIRALSIEDLKMSRFYRDTQSYIFDQLTSKVAAIVPCGAEPGEFNEALWLDSKVSRNNNLFWKLNLAWAQIYCFDDFHMVQMRTVNNLKTWEPIVHVIFFYSWRLIFIRNYS